MRKDLLYANGKVVVKDRKQDLNGFFTMCLRGRGLILSLTFKSLVIHAILQSLSSLLFSLMKLNGIEEGLECMTNCISVA